MAGARYTTRNKAAVTSRRRWTNDPIRELVHFHRRRDRVEGFPGLGEGLPHGAGQARGRPIGLVQHRRDRAVPIIAGLTLISESLPSAFALLRGQASGKPR
jgi:hypothetical protein